MSWPTPPTARLGKTMLDLTGVSVAAGDRVLLDDVTWQLGPGDRVGVVGVNGSGMPTLLRLLAGVPWLGLAATGEVTPADRAARLSDPGASRRTTSQIRGSVRIGKRELSASQLLDRLGLSVTRQWTLVAELSGCSSRCC